MPRPRVVVAMSGGVDSSVAALLLKELGYDVVGVFLRTGVAGAAREDGRHRGCCSAVDARDARHVADRLGVPCYALDFAAEFRQVMDYFADEYVRGRTPNPCVVCNSRIKFGRLWELARALDADFLATGHYARLSEVAGTPTLRRAADARKDQTYVLFGLPAALLPRLRFPIGELTKDQVRDLARAAGLGVAEKAESQDICFVPDGDAAAFVRRERPAVDRKGTVVDTQGQVLARHAGVSQFTVGQRKGLGLDRATLRGERRFVLDIVSDEGRVVIGTKEEGLVNSLHAEGCNWFINPRPGQPCLIKWSQRSDPVPGRVTVTPEGASWVNWKVAGTLRVTSPGSGTLERLGLLTRSVRATDETDPLPDGAAAEFDAPQFGVAPGQAVVFYDGDLVLGGGWIAHTSRVSGLRPAGATGGSQGRSERREQTPG